MTARDIQLNLTLSDVDDLVEAVHALRKLDARIRGANSTYWRGHTDVSGDAYVEGTLYAEHLVLGPRDKWGSHKNDPLIVDEQILDSSAESVESSFDGSVERCRICGARLGDCGEGGIDVSDMHLVSHDSSPSVGTRGHGSEDHGGSSSPRHNTDPTEGEPHTLAEVLHAYMDDFDRARGWVGRAIAGEYGLEVGRVRGRVAASTHFTIDLGDAGRLTVHKSLLPDLISWLQIAQAEMGSDK